MVRASDCDQAVVGLIPGQDAIGLPILSLPSLRGLLVNRVPAWLAGVVAGRVHVCRVAGNTV